MMRTMEDEGTALSLLQATARVVHGSRNKVADDVGPDAALSLMQPHAARFTSKNVAATAVAASAAEKKQKVEEEENSSVFAAVDTPAERSFSDSDSEADVGIELPMETAVMNIIRHAEKCPGSGEGLSPFGSDRATYLAKCMGSDRPSIAMPLGKATVVMSGAGHTSSRPGLTVKPLAEKLGLESITCSKLNPTHCFLHNALRALSNKGTIVVAWAHLAIPLLMEEFRATRKLACHLPAQYIKWPHECTPPPQTQEPACVSQNGDSPCYDAIWQLKWMRPEGSNHSMWRIYAITTLSQGFDGNPSGPCGLDLDPTLSIPPFLPPPRPPGGRRRGGGLPPGWIE